MTLKIEKYADGNSTTIRLIGRMQSEHLEELEKQIRESGLGNHIGPGRSDLSRCGDCSLSWDL